MKRLEMKVAYSTSEELTAQFGRNRRRHKLPSGGVVIQAIEQAIHPGRNGSTAHSREFPGLRNVRYRQYARYDFRINPRRRRLVPETRSEEHTSELQSLMRISYAVFCLKNKRTHDISTHKIQLME